MLGDISIYKLECLENGRVYIGKTKYPKSRKQNHFQMLKQGKHCVALMQEDYNKYGKSAFKFTVLEVVNRQAIVISPNYHKFTDAVREKELMVQYKSYLPEFGYNYRDQYFDHPFSKARRRRHE